MNPFEQRILGELIGLARATEGNEHLITESVTQLIAEILITQVPNESEYDKYRSEIESAKREMVPDCFLCANPCGRTAAFDWTSFVRESPSVQQAKLSILEELQRIAASRRSPEADLKLYRGLVLFGLEGYSPEELANLFAVV